MQRKGKVRNGVPSSKSRSPISWTEACEIKALHKGKKSNKIFRGGDRTSHVRAATLKQFVAKNVELY